MNCFFFFYKITLSHKINSGSSLGILALHKMLTSLDEGYDVSSVFLDISKAFDKIWHKGLLFKLSQNYIYGNLLNILSNFLSNRKHGTIVPCRKQIVLSKDKHLCRKTSTRRFLKVPSRTIVIYLVVYLLIQSYLLIIDLYSLWYWHFCSDPGPVLYLRA